jgi:long-chain acyl-CoA synthetase
MEVEIDSPDPRRIPGEILTRGLNVMLGYFKNPEATAETIDREGWYHTGDLGTMDVDGNIYINGRSKNMLLGPNGQNIYPEEIEDKLNSMTMVVESIVVQRDNKLVAIVYPDYEEAKNMNFSTEDIRNIMEQNRNGLNEMIPAYEKITEIEIREEEFEKTPKRSIKRYLYQ